MAKKVIERIIKVFNIMINIAIVLISFANVCQFGTNGYMYSDDVYRILWIIAMLATVNIGDYFIRNAIREF